MLAPSDVLSFVAHAFTIWNNLVTRNDRLEDTAVDTDFHYGIYL